MGNDLRQIPPNFMQEGILKKKWLDKYLNKVPSVIIWVWDLVLNDYNDNIEPFINTYIENRGLIQSWTIKVFFIIKLPNDTLYDDRKNFIRQR